MSKYDEVKMYPADKAKLTWKVDDVTFYLVKCDREYQKHYCGYCEFPKRPVREHGYDGIITYVPVHGGITYASENVETGTMTYGFDCAHYNDDKNPNCTDEVWLKNECEKMAKYIKAIVPFEKRYLRATTNKGKAKILQEYFDSIEFEGVPDSFGVHIKLLGGEL